MLQVANLSKSYGTRSLLDQVTFSIGTGERVGLVGRNGSGKSTLFKIILGIELADEGLVTIPKNYRLGYLDQHISFSKASLLEECVQVLPEEYKYEHYRAEKILSGLGFDEKDFTKPPETFSGGYQLRINLTKCLLKEPDFLLLDEPTNYLDIVSLRWMRKFMCSFPGEVLLITHDRDFMDSVCTHTMGIQRRQIRKVKGPTKKYYEQLSLDDEIHEKTRVNKEKKLKQMQEFVTRFRAKASKATQAQSVLKKIEKMGQLDELEAESFLGFQFNYAETSAKKLVEVEELAFGYGDRHLFENISFDLKPKKCLAIVGKNGKGKTTLLKVLAGHLEPKKGSINFHNSVQLGFFEQTNRKNLNPKSTVAQEIESSNIDLETSQVRAICGAMMFPGDDALKKIKVLSGGEQARVLLGKIIAHKNNLLLLDEPSNHLDMESIEVLIEEIKDFPGASVLVTHNEKILRKLATQLIVFENDSAYFFNGKYDEFLDKIGWQNEESNKKKPKKDKKTLRHERAQKVAERSTLLKPLLKQQKQLEEAIDQKEKELEGLNSQVMEALSNPNASVQDIYKTIGQLQLQIEQDYSALEEILSKIELVPDLED